MSLLQLVERPKYQHLEAREDLVLDGPTFRLEFEGEQVVLTEKQLAVES